VGNVLKMN